MSLNKNVVVLMTGTIIAQLIPALMSPFITRLYTPSDFGIYVFYFSVVSVLGHVVSGRYEEYIPLPSSDRRATLLTILPLFISTLITIFIAILAIIVYLFSPKLIGNVNYTFLDVFFIGLGTVFVAYNQVMTYWVIRKLRYKLISKCKVTQSVTNIGFSLGLGLFFKSIGLVLADIISRFLVFIIFLKSFLNNEDSVYLRKKNFKFKLCLLLRSAVNFKRYPLYIVPAALFYKIATQLPLLIIASSYSSVLAGLMMMSQRVILGPLGVITSSFSQALLKPMADQMRQTGNCWNLFSRTFILLALSPLPFVIIGFYIIDDLVPFLFGDGWEGLSDVIVIFVPYFYLFIISGTLNIIIVAAGRQKINLTLQVSLFFLIVLAFVISNLMNYEGKDLLIVLSIAYSIHYFITLIISGLLAAGKLHYFGAYKRNFKPSNEED
ncbi:lipopolysaccharide biosynthesis protein [Taylorella equigenitalis]|uniref:O-antigen flippase Wzx n=1 Tax=Taylorella equigenitalis (strain MCE9) TaxID=937774 RepID=A0A654KHT7_TAYEM|nr:oligosaccharide flippase family protein [Taylorella equigenitalis]ADU91945.1 hypothetical protein TEQUI_1020 [Taylorella equigenitalis MCE9]ASY40455.1 translocase [Taylorella equigenitalis]WDU56717.1 oligosaccharide flippase family protein [Taylorella equigenitalis]